jgi:hypothetical protein
VDLESWHERVFGGNQGGIRSARVGRDGREGRTKDFGRGVEMMYTWLQDRAVGLNYQSVSVTMLFSKILRVTYMMI